MAAIKQEMSPSDKIRIKKRQIRQCFKCQSWFKYENPSARCFECRNRFCFDCIFGGQLNNQMRRDELIRDVCQSCRIVHNYWTIGSK